MFDKKKFNEAKATAVKLMKERPLETIVAVTAAAAVAVKMVNSVTEARNASTWRAEVKRREHNSRRNYQD